MYSKVHFLLDSTPYNVYFFKGLPDLLDDPLEARQELHNNQVQQARIQRERLAIEEVLLEEIGLEFEDEEPLDPEILEAWQNHVKAWENPVGFFEGFIAALDNMENEDQKIEANIPCQIGGPLTVANFSVVEANTPQHQERSFTAAKLEESSSEEENDKAEDSLLRYMYLHGLWEIHAKTMTGIHIVPIVNASDKISTVKEKIQGKIANKPEFQRLAGNGLELDDERILQDYNVHPGRTLQMVYPRGKVPLDLEFLAINGYDGRMI